MGLERSPIKLVGSNLLVLVLYAIHHDRERISNRGMTYMIILDGKLLRLHHPVRIDLVMLLSH